MKNVNSIVTYGLLDAILHVLSEDEPLYERSGIDGDFTCRYDARLVDLLGDFRYQVNPRALGRFDQDSLYDYGPLEIETFICRIKRWERFCDGLIAMSIKSGHLETLCLRMMNFF